MVPTSSAINFSTLYMSDGYSQIHDVKLLLSDVSENDRPDNIPWGQVDFSFPFSGVSVETLSPWLPFTPEHCFFLLDIYFLNVDPVSRLLHKPSLQRRFSEYVGISYLSHTQEEPRSSPTSDSSLNIFEPLAFAIFYASVNSMASEAVLSKFGAEKRDLLARFQHGVELGLGREKFLTTSSIEVLQAFVLFLVRSYQLQTGVDTYLETSVMSK